MKNSIDPIVNIRAIEGDPGAQYQLSQIYSELADSTNHDIDDYISVRNELSKQSFYWCPESVLTPRVESGSP